MHGQKPGPIIGQAGVKYGLQRPGAKAAASKAAAPKKTLNIFGDDDSDEEDVEAQIARQANKKRQDAKAAQLQAEALAQDPSVFAYDEVYENIQTAREQPRQQEKQVRKAKYIEMLLHKAEERKKEQDMSFERRQVKDRQKEDYMFEGKEKFVTSAYRKKLEEDKKWLESERLRELEEEKRDVRKVGHMGNFYKNLLTGNVAFGTAKEQPNEKTSGSGEEDTEGPSTAEPDAKVLEKAKKMEEALDEYERMRLEAERELREKKTRQAWQEEEKENEGEQDEGPSGREDQPDLHDQDPDERRDKKDASNSSRLAQAATAAPGAAGEDEGGNEPPGQLLTGGRRKADEGTVSAARERYLARKKAKTGG